MDAARSVEVCLRRIESNLNADHATQLRLLDLQSADTALAQLAHRRKTLPELAALQEREARATTLHDEIVDATTQVADVAAEQRRRENEVETVQARAQRDEQRLQAGGLPSRELESLQHEIATLSRRKASLEDDLLEVMEQREEAEGSLADLTAQREVLDAERADLEKSRDAALAEIDASTTERQATRDSLVGSLPADLVALYEKAREHGGAGAAMLRQRRCEACHIELPGTEVAALRAAADDAIVRCDNCRAILIRTDESGL